MTVGELTEILLNFEPERKVVIEQRIKTGYDQGDIYHSLDVAVDASREGKVILAGLGFTIAGGW